MAHKQFLHELLREDQEPFQLKSYIAERCSEFKNHSYTSTLGVKKCKPIVSETSAKQSILCKNGCFFSFQNSPDVRKSPFLEFPSPVKSPCKSSTSGVFLHIPARTTALLVEAAIRIQNQQQSKPKAQIKNVRFGLFGSILKRLKDGNRNKKSALADNDINVSRRNEPEIENQIEESIRISCSCNNSRLSSDDSSETNEEKSMDLEASTSSYRSEDFACREKRFCSSPLGPFRFSMHNSPSSSGRQTPDFCTPAASPSRHVEKEKENFDTKNSEKVSGDEDHEEKDQCSPVSVLDPSFDDDYENCRGGEDADEDDYDIECSYANVQRAKQQLLYRLQRFEKLAELDPMELERALLEGSDDDDNNEEERGNEESEEFNEPLSPYREHSSIDTFVNETFNNSNLKHSTKTSTNIKSSNTKKLTDQGCREIMSGLICNRLDSWKELDFNTIDMMIESDVKTDYDGWKDLSEHVKETAEEIEVAIFDILMEQLSDELFYT